MSFFLNRQDFERQASNLVLAIVEDEREYAQHEEETINQNPPVSTTTTMTASIKDVQFRLKGWECIRTIPGYHGDPTLYLVHPSTRCVTHYHHNERGGGGNHQPNHDTVERRSSSDGGGSGDGIDDDVDQILLLQGDAEVDMLHDEDRSNQTGVPNAIYLLSQEENDKNTTTLQTEWTFSIVYSETYRVPVLYFHVHNMKSDGNVVACGRQEVLNIILHYQQKQQHNPDNCIPEDTWEFISQEDHPVTGLPSFFLHPCQSADRLKSVFLQDGLSKPSKLYLWTWMSMLLPAVGHPVPSSYFVRIRNRLEQQMHNSIINIGTK